MKAIRTFYRGATATRPAKIHATDEDGNRISLPDYIGNTSVNDRHKDAALALCSKMGWRGRLVGGRLGPDHVFVWLDDSLTFDATQPEPVAMPAKRYDISDIRCANHARGFHWFDRSTLRFFRGRVLPSVYQGNGGVFFVSSEQFVGSDGVAERRMFTIREFKPETGHVDTFGPFNRLTRERAQRIARIAAEYRQVAAEALAACGV